MIAATIAFIAAALFALRYTQREFVPRPSISFILFGSLLLIHGIPMLVYLHLTGPTTFIYEAALEPVDAEAVKVRMLWALACMFVSLVIGAELARLIVPRSWRRAQLSVARSSQRSLATVYRATSLMRIALWLVAVAMLSLILIEGQPAKIVNYFVSGETELDKILLRHEAGGSQFYLYNVFLSSLAPFIVIMLWCMHRADPKDRQLYALLVCFFTLVLVGKLGSLSKAPPVIFLLQLAVLSFLLKNEPLSFWPLTRLLLLAVALFSVTVWLTIPGIELGAIFSFLYYRVFDIPNESILEYFSAFPHTLRFGWEYGLFGPLGRSVQEVILPNYSAVAEITRESLVSTSNVVFIGDAWAEYEWLGIFVTSLMAGMLTRLIDLYSLRNGRTEEWACLIAGCSLGIFTMLSTAFSTALVTGGLALIPLLSWLFLRRRRKQFRRRARAIDATRPSNCLVAKQMVAALGNPTEKHR